MRIIKIIKLAVGNISFVCNNLLKLRSKNNVKPTNIGEIFIRGMQSSEEKQVLEIYHQLNGGARISWSRRWLYRLAGSKLMLVAVKKDLPGEKIVGMNMYYLNKRDIDESTIHEGFIGVLPEMSGLSIATHMRNIAKKQFSENGFKGISTRISLNNLSSLKSAEKIGFKPVEKYLDVSTEEERYYMICALERNQ
jgi:ribosomal protein S18 acetylase RimI-like enzyme